MHVGPDGKAACTRLVADAAARYRASGSFAYYFARGKLGTDPVFAAVLEHALIPDGARILDLGCGQGLLAAWLAAAQHGWRSGAWPSGWPAPPQPVTYRGVERNVNEVTRARQALDASAKVTAGDVRSAELAGENFILLLDVLHYLAYHEQETLLRRLGSALHASGKLLLRVGDAQGGLRFHCSQWIDSTVLALRGHPGARLSCRALPDWLALLGSAGLSALVVPMVPQAFSANVLLLATGRPPA